MFRYVRNIKMNIKKVEKLESIENKIDRIESDISALNNTSKQMNSFVHFTK